MNKKSTKRALLGSVLSLLLCCAMLIGTTFAWFTDSVSSNGNKIQSGTLKISLHKMEKNGTWTDISDNTDPLFNYNLWEPGYTAVQLLKVQNDGNLALKWQADLTYTGTISKLAEVIDVYVTTNELTAYPTGREVVLGWEKKGTLKDFIDGFATATQGELNAGENNKAYLGIALHMQESANNDYQTLDLGGNFDIKIFATQNTVEEDSFDETYDAGAYLPTVYTAAELKSAIENGGNIKLGADIEVQGTMVAANDVVLDLNGKTITNTGGTGNHTFRVAANMTVKNGKIDNTAGGYCFVVGYNTPQAGNLIIESGEYYGNTSVISVTYGLVEIKDGYFEASPYNGDNRYTFNCVDRFYNAGTADIVVKGGTFYNFNPENNESEGANTNYVADGYKAVDNGDGTWTVDSKYVAGIGSQGYEKLQDAINNVSDGDTIVLTKDITEEVSFTQTADKSFVIDGNRKTMNGNIGIEARAGKDAPSTLVIKDINFVTDETDYDFIYSVETNYYPNNITVEGCTFTGTGSDSDVVPVRIKSANNFVIKDCKATKVHSLLQNTAGWKLKVQNVEVTEAGRGMSLGSCQGVTLEKVKIEAADNKYGVRFEPQYSATTTFKDCEISAFIPVVARKATATHNVVFEGTNTFTPANTDGLWCAIGSSEYENNGTMPTAATGNVTVTLNDNGLDKTGIYGAASINE